MGLGVAEYFAAAGIRMCLSDATPELARQAQEQLVQRVRGHVDAGLLGSEVLESATAVEAAEDVRTAVQGTDLVFEAVPERLSLKCDVLNAIDAAARPEAIIASNTSSLPIDDLAASISRPNRFLGMLWLNPPEWVPGVEIIPASVTEPQVVEQTMDFLRAIGKRPTLVGSGPGFVANRIQFALFREALACVEDGLASPQEVDEVVQSCFGFKFPFFGPFLAADMAGLDVYANVFETLERGLGETFRAPPALRALVEQGYKGTKTGKGFFTHSSEESERLLLERDRRYAALGDLLLQLPPLGLGSERSQRD